MLPGRRFPENNARVAQWKCQQPPYCLWNALGLPQTIRTGARLLLLLRLHLLLLLTWNASGSPLGDKLFFDLIQYRYDMRVFSRYDIRASKKTFFLRNFRQIFRIFGIFGEFLEFSALLLLRTLVHGFSEFFGEFSEFSENF